MTVYLKGTKGNGSSLKDLVSKLRILVEVERDIIILLEDSKRRFGLIMKKVMELNITMEQMELASSFEEVVFNKIEELECEEDDEVKLEKEIRKLNKFTYGLIHLIKSMITPWDSLSGQVF